MCNAKTVTWCGIRCYHLPCNFSLLIMLFYFSSTHRLGYKRVMLFTNNDNPHSDNAALQRQAKTKAGDLHETGIDLELMHMQKPGEVFDASVFYKVSYHNSC